MIFWSCAVIQSYLLEIYNKSQMSTLYVHFTDAWYHYILQDFCIVIESQSEVFHNMYQLGLFIIKKYPPSKKLNTEISHHLDDWNALFHSLGKQLNQLDILYFYPIMVILLLLQLLYLEIGFLCIKYQTNMNNSAPVMAIEN